MFLIQYWNAPTIPDDVAALMSRFQAANPTLAYLRFNEASAHAFILEHLTSREASAFAACSVPALQADYFRYCATYVLGGLYADADLSCEQDLTPLLDQPGSAQFFCTIRNVRNDIFVSRMIRHPFLAAVIRVVTTLIEQRASNHVWALAGPGVLTAFRALRNNETAAAFDLDLARRKPDVQEALGRTMAVIQDLFGGQIEALLHDVAFRPEADLAGFVANGGDLSYKSTPSHWSNWPGPIFEDRHVAGASNTAAPPSHLRRS